MKLNRTIALLFIVFNSLTALVAGASELPLYIDMDLPSQNAKTPAFQDIVSSLRSSSQLGHETIAEVLADLKVRFPDFFDYYVLNYSSSSLQGSSRALPRVILHGNGNLFLAFNGDAKARGYSDLEIIEFKGTSGYEFRSLHFPKDGATSRVDANEISERIGSIEVSKPNPTVCTSCHGSQARPIWDPYTVWPGFYGADDDGLFMYGRAKSDYAPFEGPDLDTPAYADLKKHYKNHPRYKNLEGILASHRLLTSPKDRINRNVTKIFSDQMSRRLLQGLEENESALETIGAIEGCRTSYLPDSLTQSTRLRLQESLANQRQRFAMSNGAYSLFSPVAVEFMSGPRLASNMTAYEIALSKYAQRNLLDYSYTRMRGYDLQDGRGGLHALSLMARDLLKRRFHHDVDFHRCDELLARLESPVP